MAKDEEVQQYNWPATLAFLGGLIMLFLWRRRRRRKRLEKMVKDAQRRAEARQKRAKERKKGRKKVKPHKAKAARSRRKEKEKASMVAQLVRFAVFQFLKKVISEQINRIELDLQKSPLGAKLTRASEPRRAST